MIGSNSEIGLLGGAGKIKGGGVGQVSWQCGNHGCGVGPGVWLSIDVSGLHREYRRCISIGRRG